MTPAASICSAFSRDMTSPASAIISPVEGSATGIASVKPFILPRSASFLLNL